MDRFEKMSISQEDFDLALASKDGEILLLKQELEFKSQCAEIFNRQLNFWRSKYLKDHPEQDNWEYATLAYINESGEDFTPLTPPSQSK